MEKIWDMVSDAVFDSVKLLPFLFLTYLAMEYLEHYTGEKTARAIQRAGRFGPFPGALLGLLPQCGFSAAAAGLYAGRVITGGARFGGFIAPADEMLPILISEGAPASMAARILAVKFLFGMLFGFLVDFLYREPGRYGEGKGPDAFREERRAKEAGEDPGTVRRKREAAHGEMCGRGIFRPALFHTLQVFVFLFLITLLLNGAVAWLGEDSLQRFLLSRPVVGEMLTALFGLFPNCAVSVAITRLYLAGAMSAGAMTAGLLSGAGVGLLVLFRVNRDRRQNGKIVCLLYASAVAGGLLVSGLGVVF